MNEESSDGKEERKQQEETQRLLFEIQRQQHRWQRWGIRFRILRTIFVSLLLLGAAILLFSPGFFGGGPQVAEIFPVGEKRSLVPGNLREPHIAMVRFEGLLEDGGAADAETINQGLRHAFQSEGARVVVLSINSPGGSPVQAGYIYDEMRRLRARHQDRKLYAVIRDIGASGAYYAAAAADRIYADRASLVGSIGVISSGFGFVEAMRKIGVERRLYTAGENKGFLDSFSPQNPEQVEAWKNTLDLVHRQFIDRVLEGRGERLKGEKELLFSGFIWTGEQALELGLIDDLQSVSSLAAALDLPEIIDYTIQPSWPERFFEGLGVTLSTAFSRLLASSGGLR